VTERKIVAAWAPVGYSLPIEHGGKVMQQGRGQRLRVTSIQMGKHVIPTNFTLAPGEVFSLRWDGDGISVVREFKYPLVKAARRQVRRNGRKEKKP
jgi:hypothetical protein